MGKKIYAILLSLCMLTMLVPSAFAATTSFVLSLDKTEVEQGSQVTATVRVKDAVNITTVGYKLVYDSSVLEVEQIKKGNIMSYTYTSISMVSEGSKVDETHGSINATLGFNGKYDISDDILFTVTFNVKDDAKITNSPQRVIAASANPKDSVIDSNQIETTIESSSITVLPAPAKVYEFDVKADKEYPVIGDTVTYTISAPEAVPMSGWQANLTYDKDVMEYVGGEIKVDGDIVNVNDKGTGETVLLWANTSAAGATTEFKDEIAYVKYKIKNAGNTAINADVVSAPNKCSLEFPTVIISGKGTVLATADKEVAKAGDVVNVSISSEEFDSQKAIQFDLIYDKNALNIDANSISINADISSGASVRLIEEGRIRFIYADTTGLTGAVTLLSFNLKATGNTDGLTTISFEEKVGQPLFNTSNTEIYLYNTENTNKINEVIDLINSLPATDEITAENYDEVKAITEDARNKYELLPETAKSFVDTAKLEECEAVFVDAQTVIDLIEALEDPTAEMYLTSKAAVATARASYDALNEESKTRITNYDKLTAAESALEELKVAVDNAATLIDAIGEVTADSYADAKTNVAAAEEAYNSLVGEQKQAVENAQKLTDSLAALNELKTQIANVEASINAIGVINESNFREKKALIDTARSMYDSLNEAMKADVTNAGALETAETLYAQFVKDVDIVISDSENGYDVKVEKNNSAMTDQAVMIALYNADGTLAALSISSTANTETVSISKTNDEQTCRVFVWNSITEMKPYSSVGYIYNTME